MVNLDPKVDVERARALVTMPSAVAREAVEQAALSLCERRARRERRGRSGQQHRCQGCNLFMASTNGVCKSCGYRQDVGWAA